MRYHAKLIPATNDEAHYVACLVIYTEIAIDGSAVEAELNMDGSAVFSFNDGETRDDFAVMAAVDELEVETYDDN